MARTAPALFLNPFLGGALVPGPAKIGLSLAVAILMLPLLVKAPSPMPGGVEYMALFAKEAAIGATLGFISSLVFWGIASAGRFIDTQRGANMAESLVQQLGERTSALGLLFFQTSIVVFLSINGHHQFLSGLVRSFELLPVWAFPEWGGTLPFALETTRLTADLLVVAVQLSAPAVITLFIVDFAFGLLSRTAGRINVFTLSFSVKMFVGLVLVLLTTHLLAREFAAISWRSLADFGRFIELLGR